MIPALALRVLFVVGVVAFLTGAGWYARGVVAERDEAATVARMAAEREAQIAAHMRETERRLAAQKEIADEAERKTRAARADAARAAVAAGSLRTHVAALAERAATCDPAAAGDGPADRLADVLGQCVERYGAVAAAADRAIVAGQQCQRAYDSLTAAQ